MSIHTILGAGGVIANGLAKELISHNERVRMVSRHPAPFPGAETTAADITNLQQTLLAVKDSTIIYLCIGLKYDYALWRLQWPRIMDNVIEAARQTGAKLMFLDNVYMYGRVEGTMTEETPYDPSSRKGDLRARLATQLMSEVRKGNITAIIARAADFYGPGGDKVSIPNILVFANLAKNKKAQWLVNAHAKHSFTYTADIAKAMYLLAINDHAWNQVWHLPTASPALTGKEFIKLAVEAFGPLPASPGGGGVNSSKYTVLNKWMVKLAGLFNKDLAESYEMLYQSKYDYVFDSSKFEKAFNFQPTPYREGIYATAQAYKHP